MMLRPFFYIQFALCIAAKSTTSFAEFIPFKIITGSSHTCVLSTERAIKCWGYNFNGQLGSGDTVQRGHEPGTMGENLLAVDLGLSSSDKVADLCAGNGYTCARTEGGGVKCWGGNIYGQLGQGVLSTKNYTMGKALPFTDLGKGFKVKDLACGGSHVCALSDKGFVKCWGANSKGSLGLGDKTNRGHAPEDMGDKLPALKGLTDIQAISAGFNNSCALSSQGVRCWGNGEFGQLGLEAGGVSGTTPETIPGKSPFISLSSDPDDKIISLTSGYAATCSFLTAKTVANPFFKCWGYNLNGALGTGDAIQHGLTPGTMGAKLPQIDLNLDEITSLNPHLAFTCALSKAGRVKCWGVNDIGELGLGDMRSRGKAPTEMGKNLPDVDLGLPVKAISSGALSSHSCAILINNGIKCWGDGGDGVLGYENEDTIGFESGQMGDALPFVRFN